MLNIFKKRNSLEKSTNYTLNNLAKSINNQTNNKEDLEDFILVLEQIQEVNNAKEQGKGCVMKNYAIRKRTIDNIIKLTKENINKKIVELDNRTI